MWFFDVDCISTISGEVSFYVHSSCSACYALMSDYSLGSNANTAKPKLHLFSPKAALCFLSYQQWWLWCNKLRCEINMFGLIPGHGVLKLLLSLIWCGIVAAAKRLHCSKSSPFGSVQCVFSTLKKQNKTLKQCSLTLKMHRCDVESWIFPPCGGIFSEFTPIWTSQNYE